MKRLRKKSQHEIMFIVFQLLMVAAIFASLMFYVTSLKENTLFKKLALSRDIALLVNTLYAAPGNVEYDYYVFGMNISIFDYSLEKQKVNVFEKDIATVYLYGDDLLFDNVPLKIRAPEKIKFENRGYIFSAKKYVEEEEKPDLYKYPYVEIKESKGKVMVGFYNEENLLAKTIAAELNAGIEGVGRIQDADTLIIAEPDNRTFKTLKIEISANPEFVKQNRKLASLIMNNAMERGNIEYAIIIPTARSELNKAKTAVYLSLSDDVPITDVSQIISQSLNEHFG